MGRRRVLAGSIVLVIAVGAVAARPYFAGRGVTTVVPLDELQRRYQEAASATIATSTGATSTGATSPEATSTGATGTGSTSVDSTSAGDTTEPSGPTATAQLPRPGVYVYTTSGGDSVDALSGDHHQYPTTTAITVTLSGCGVLQRWDAAVERWQQWTRCIDGDGIAQTDRTNYGQFFGVGQTDAYDCDGEPRPVAGSPGETWSFTCRHVGDEELEVVSGTVIGIEAREVDGVSVETLHVRLVIDPGTSDDSQVTDSWYLLGSDLLIAQTEANATTESTVVGEVHYVEQYKIELTSLEPLA